MPLFFCPTRFRMSSYLPAPYLQTTPKCPHARFLFCHGAGAPMDSDFMQCMTQLLVDRGIEVVRFEFPYMAERRASGNRRPPNPMKQVLEYLNEQVAYWSQVDDLPLFVGGKSMGGRAAAMLARTDIVGVIALGYPLHPISQPEKLRLEPLQNRQNPLFIVQGERDKLGSRACFEPLVVDKTIQWLWLADADHDLKPRIKSGLTHAQHLADAADAVLAFMSSHLTLREPNP